MRRSHGPLSFLFYADRTHELHEENTRPLPLLAYAARHKLTELCAVLPRQVPRVKPQEEQEWHNLEAAAAAATADALSSCTQVLRLPDIIACHMQPSSLASIPWLRSIMATRNFVQSVALPPRSGVNLSDYMRPLDALLLFDDGSVVLVSEREADALQGLCWRHSHQRSSSSSSSSCSSHNKAPVLMQLCYARCALHGGKPPLLAQKLDRSPMHPGLLRSFTLPCLTNLQLFDGETMYTDSSVAGSIGQRVRSAPFKELQQLVPCKRKAAEELVSLRGKLPMFPRSDLELASDGGQEDMRA